MIVEDQHDLVSSKLYSGQAITSLSRPESWWLVVKKIGYIITVQYCLQLKTNKTECFSYPVQFLESSFFTE
jgi:hypothetical protein